MIKILPNTKFSYSYSQGTLAKRFKSCDELNHKIFDRIMQLYDKKTLCGIGVIKNSYNKFLPENKKIEILPMQIRDYDKYGGSTRVDQVGDNLVGYTIELPTNIKKKLNILELPELMHESTHVLDYLFNPKYISNYRQMCKKNIFEKDYYNVYQKWFYNTEEMIQNRRKEMLEKTEEETRKAIEKVPHDEKIIFLNYIKYQMQMEKHAYEQEMKYANMQKRLGRQTDDESLCDYSSELCFDKKIRLVNNLIKEEIENQRIKNLDLIR